MSECVKVTVMHNLYAGFIKTHELLNISLKI